MVWYGMFFHLTGRKGGFQGGGVESLKGQGFWHGE